MRLGCEGCHARKRWVENLGIMKKTLVEICLWAGPALASPAGGYGMRSAFLGSDSTVSIVKIVSLSPRVEKLKSRIW